MECRHTFGKPKRLPANYSDFVKFYNFVLNKLNKTALSEEMFLSRTTLWRKFSPFFHYLVLPEDSFFLLRNNSSSRVEKHWVLGIDGKWLRRFGVVMIYRNVTSGTNLYWRFHTSESYEAVESDFNNLLPLIKNSPPSCVISDWKGAIVSSVRQYLPTLPHQRCLSHVKREACRLLPLRSPFLATRMLRTTAQKLKIIENKKEKKLWIKEVNDWIKEYEFLLKEKTIGISTKKKWWYTHGNLRRGVRLLTRNYENMFVYLNYFFLPKTNNSLEGLNSQIKTKLSNHRGMKIDQQTIFISWFFTFNRVETRSDLKQLWARLKNKIFAV